ncbi:hypothetical protein [Leptolyngbya sp. FACHB-261]|uniref:hypothetical protein n=1 Tax=Leptolyngbya sp. FACHB-261 TaxID=2692806 RepID=UPI001684475A|nr:hypothetical protein [Leptolyngbya sp. FACHB-261]MBD2102396.1 hypothetical protein [Leptolyngbya sp. FACHB-261]
MPKNQISADLSDEDQQAAMAGLALVREKLSCLIDLTPAERKALSKVGDKTRFFIERAMQIAMQNPNALPRSFDIEEMRRDLELTEALYPLLIALTQLQELVSDTYRLASSEAYTAARTVYYHAKGHATSNDVNGLDTVLGQMKRRYPSTTRKKKNNPPTSDA